MSFGLVAILLLVFGMMTWPILLLKPKPEQKQREAQYAKATALGMKMQEQAPTLPPVLQSRYTHLSYCLSFSKPAIHGMLDKTYTAIRNPDSKEWFWPNKERPNTAILQALLDVYNTLPSWCLAVEHGPIHSSIFTAKNHQDISELPALLDSLNLIISKPVAKKTD